MSAEPHSHEGELDHDARLAIADLADQLAPALETVASKAIRDALGRISSAIDKHSGDLNDANQQVSSLLRDLGADMKAKASAALAAGIASDVIPVLRQECLKFREESQGIMTSVARDAARAQANLEEVKSLLPKLRAELAEQRRQITLLRVGQVAVGLIALVALLFVIRVHG